MALAVSNQQSRDAALLRATTELFVLEAAHDRDEIHRFEELATHFLTKVGAADRAFVAERLSRSADAPASVLRILGKDLAEVAAPILKRSPALAEFDFLAIMAATGYTHHRLIATRTDLTPTIVSALRRTGDEEVIQRLAAYPAVAAELPHEPLDTPQPARIAPVAATPPAEPMETPAPAAAKAEAREVFAAARAMAASLGHDFDRLAAPARQNPPPPQPLRPAAAESSPAIKAVTDLPGEVRPVLAVPLPRIDSAPQKTAPTAAPAEVLPGAAGFLDLDRAERMALLARLEEAKPTPARHSSILDADAVFRLALGRARVGATLRQKQRQSLIHALAEGLRIDPLRVTALVDDPSGEALVVLLKAIGLSEAESQQVLLFANPPIAEAAANFVRLAKLLGETGKPAADRLVEAWQGSGKAGEPRLPTAARPSFTDMELRRTARTLPSQPQPAEVAERGLAGLRGG